MTANTARFGERASFISICASCTHRVALHAVVSAAAARGVRDAAVGAAGAADLWQGKEMLHCEGIEEVTTKTISIPSRLVDV